jgi:selenocysteine lyase/cysteine desulfurase
VHDLTNYAVDQVRARGCRVESPRGKQEWSGILLFSPPLGGAGATELVAAMHAQRININAREGCIHMGIHFYNTRDEIDRVLQVIDEGAERRPISP